MTVPREVILDLMPLYLAGEGSPVTRALVEEYLRDDPALAARLTSEWTETLGRIALVPPRPENELRSLRRTRRLLAVQRWLFAVGLFFTLFSFSSQLNFEGTHITEAHLLMRDYPAIFGGCLTLGLSFLATYMVLRRRLRAIR